MDTEKIIVLALSAIGLMTLLISGGLAYDATRCEPQSHVMASDLSAPIHCDPGSLAEVQVDSRNGVRIVTCVCPADR